MSARDVLNLTSRVALHTHASRLGSATFESSTTGLAGTLALVNYRVPRSDILQYGMDFIDSGTKGLYESMSKS